MVMTNRWNPGYGMRPVQFAVSTTAARPASFSFSTKPSRKSAKARSSCSMLLSSSPRTIRQLHSGGSHRAHRRYLQVVERDREIQPHRPSRRDRQERLHISPSRYIHAGAGEEYRPIAEIVEELEALEAESRETDAALKKILARLGV